MTRMTVDPNFNRVASCPLLCRHHSSACHPLGVHHRIERGRRVAATSTRPRSPGVTVGTLARVWGRRSGRGGSRQTRRPAYAEPTDVSPRGAAASRGEMRTATALGELHGRQKEVLRRLRFPGVLEQHAVLAMTGRSAQPKCVFLECFESQTAELHCCAQYFVSWRPYGVRGSNRHQGNLYLCLGAGPSFAHHTRHRAAWHARKERHAQSREQQPHPR
eukprot:COSAG01_NODE_1542_length_9973_cov_11.546992_7_plen_218_part_00